MAERRFAIPIGEKQIPAIITSCETNEGGNAWIILTHGAGGDMNAKQLCMIAEHLAYNGFMVLRFTCKPPNFKYRVKVLTKIIDYVKKELKAARIIVGGRSMGGRVAAEIACNQSITDDPVVSAVFCLSYPLHKPKENNNLRTSHLKGIEIPLFIVNGTKDNMCNAQIMNEQFDALSCKNKTLKWIEHADHSLENVDFERTIGNVCKLLVEWLAYISQ